jgi:hypothetical protein
VFCVLLSLCDGSTSEVERSNGFLLRNGSLLSCVTANTTFGEPIEILLVSLLMWQPIANL